MTFWEVLSLIGFGATVLGAWLTASAYYNGRAIRALMRDFAGHFDRRHAEPHEMIREMQQGTRALLERMDARMERMDKRADDRHRDTLEVINTLRA